MLSILLELVFLSFMLYKIGSSACSGGLIGSRHVLTAGHCFDSVFTMKEEKIGEAKIGSVFMSP